MATKKDSKDAASKKAPAKKAAAKAAPKKKVAPKKAAAKKSAARKTKASAATASDETAADEEHAHDEHEEARPAEKRYQRIGLRPSYRTPRGTPSDTWVLIDGAGQVVGRLATQIANILSGKNKPNYSRDVLTGDHVIVINAAKVRFTGNKAVEKLYYRHSMYPGGLKITTSRQMFERHPERVLQLAVRGMLPKNALGRQMQRNLRIFNGPTHNHQAQLNRKAS